MCPSSTGMLFEGNMSLLTHFLSLFLTCSDYSAAQHTLVSDTDGTRALSTIHHFRDFIHLWLISSSFFRPQWRWWYLPLCIGGRANCTCETNVTYFLPAQGVGTSGNCSEQMVDPHGQRQDAAKTHYNSPEAGWPLLHEPFSAHTVLMLTWHYWHGLFRVCREMLQSQVGSFPDSELIGPALTGLQLLGLLLTQLFGNWEICDILIPHRSQLVHTLNII